VTAVLVHAASARAIVQKLHADPTVRAVAESALWWLDDGALVAWSEHRFHRAWLRENAALVIVAAELALGRTLRGLEVPEDRPR
jgi:hypothetical protein